MSSNRCQVDPGEHGKEAPSLPTPLAPQPAGEPEKHAWLAQKKQDLLGPLEAVRACSQQLLEEARERGPESFREDLRKIQASAEHLRSMIEEVLNPVLLTAETDLAKRVRHDLRTPLNHILGYCELWLEDAAEQFLDSFLPDLQALHTLGKQLLQALDEVLVSVATNGTLLTPSLSLSAPAITPLPKGTLPSSRERPEACVEADQGTMLVVDDDEGNRDILSRWLLREGHTVAVAANGRQALEMIRAQPFDLVLLDILMPEMNGFEVLEQLKADAQLRHLPVILISAFNEIDSVANGIKLGAEDYLPKPFNAVLLQARISACLEKKRLRDREVRYLQQIKQEQQRADELLHVIFPTQIVQELKATNTVRARRYENVAVLFCDIVGFTPFCDKFQPEQVVPFLQHLIETWEEIALRHDVDKIKTIGDAFMAASGLLRPAADCPILNCVRCGLEMITATQQLPTGWNLRVGIHAGPVVAGVIGRRQYLFDLWGDTVNTAARMESHGVPGKVVLSGTAWKLIAGRCQGESLQHIPVKGKGPMEMVRFDGFRDS